MVHVKVDAKQNPGSVECIVLWNNSNGVQSMCC